MATATALPQHGRKASLASCRTTSPRDGAASPRAISLWDEALQDILRVVLATQQDVRLVVSALAATGVRTPDGLPLDEGSCDSYHHQAPSEEADCARAAVCDSLLLQENLHGRTCASPARRPSTCLEQALGLAADRSGGAPNGAFELGQRVDPTVVEGSQLPNPLADKSAFLELICRTEREKDQWQAEAQRLREELGELEGHARVCTEALGGCAPGEHMASAVTKLKRERDVAEERWRNYDELRRKHERLVAERDALSIRMKALQREAQQERAHRGPSADEYTRLESCCGEAESEAATLRQVLQASALREEELRRELSKVRTDNAYGDSPRGEPPQGQALSPQSSLRSNAQDVHSARGSPSNRQDLFGSPSNRAPSSLGAGSPTPMRAFRHALH